jgi:hypothetical protein
LNHMDVANIDRGCYTVAYVVIVFRGMLQ